MSPDCYRVKVATAMLRVRRKGATAVPPGQTEPVPAPFSASTTIAAGQKNSDEHKAEVQVTLWSNRGTAIGGHNTYLPGKGEGNGALHLP